MKIKTKEIIHTTAEALGVEEVCINPEKTPSSLIIPAPVLKQQVYELYMRHVPYADIIATSGVNQGTLASWISRDGWPEKRKANDIARMQDLLQSKHYKLDQVVDLTLDAIITTIKKIVKDGCSTKDLGNLASVASQIEKLARLTKGQATSISEERSKRAQFTLPIEHLKDANLVKIKDPFAIEEAKPNVDGTTLTRQDSPDPS